MSNPSLTINFVSQFHGRAMTGCFCVLVLFVKQVSNSRLTLNLYRRLPSAPNVKGLFFLKILVQASLPLSIVPE
jgi:hypothetical protein